VSSEDNTKIRVVLGVDKTDPHDMVFQKIELYSNLSILNMLGRESRGKLINIGGYNSGKTRAGRMCARRIQWRKRRHTLRHATAGLHPS
jgi:hypothetical protein